MLFDVAVNLVVSNARKAGKKEVEKGESKRKLRRVSFFARARSEERDARGG